LLISAFFFFTQTREMSVKDQGFNTVKYISIFA